MPPEHYVAIKQQPQRQDSLVAQLETVVVAANRLGCYDAADWIRKQARMDMFGRLMNGEDMHA